jgi:hypothetical protein
MAMHVLAMAQLAGRQLSKVAIDVDEVVKKSLHDRGRRREIESAKVKGANAEEEEEGHVAYIERAIGDHLEAAGRARDEVSARS